MTEQEKPKIEFPCPDYVIKIMGDATDGFQSTVEEIVEQVAPGYDRSKTTTKLSAKGNFVSVNVWITATGKDQLEDLHVRLKADSRVKMVL